MLKQRSVRELMIDSLSLSTQYPQSLPSCARLTILAIHLPCLPQLLSAFSLFLSSCGFSSHQFVFPSGEIVVTRLPHSQIHPRIPHSQRYHHLTHHHDPLHPRIHHPRLVCLPSHPYSSGYPRVVPYDPVRLDAELSRVLRGGGVPASSGSCEG